MKATDYADRVVRDFIVDITDHLFLQIQHDETLMREYQTRVNENSLQAVNQAIGLKIKEILQLENVDVCHEPKSWLIKDYTRHKIRV